MILLGSLFLSLLTFEGVLHLSKILFKQMEFASHFYGNNPDDCPSNIQDYALGEYPEHCIPPPTDHSASLASEERAAPAFCLFIRSLENPDEVKITSGDREYSCSHF